MAKKKPPEKKKNKKQPSEAMTCSSRVSLAVAQAQRDVRVPGEGLPEAAPPVPAALSPGGRGGRPLVPPP